MIVIYTVLITLCNSFSLLVATHPSHTERRINLTYNMDDVTHHHGDRQRLYWTPKMYVDLLHCRDIARQLHSSEDCPRKVNSHRQGVMELTKRFWDEKGYQNLERTAQNLQDKIGHIEKSSQTAAVLIDNEIDEQCLQLINAEEQSEQHTVTSNNNEAHPNINTEQTSDTHIPESEYITNVTPQSTMVENTQQPLHSNIAPEWETLRQKAFVIYTNVKEELGNWKTRKITHSLKWSQTKQKSNTRENSCLISQRRPS